MGVQDFMAILPEFIIVLTALAAIVVDVWAREKNASAALGVTVGGFLLSGISALVWMGEGGLAMSGAVFHDGYTTVFRVLFSLVGIVTALYSPLYLRFRNMRLGEYYSLLAMCVFGMMVMVSAANLLLFFVGLETMSIGLYALAGLRREESGSVEAGLKYLLMGSFASAFFLYGIALVYGGTGTVTYEGIAQCFSDGHSPGPMTLTGLALLLVGFAFKVSAVPFHFWSPDVYEGSPTTITAFMSTGPKAAAFVGLIRVFGVAFAPTSEHWTTALSVIAALTMTLGNVVALRQTSVKRMLAYSSIAHAGYLLVGVVAGTNDAFAAAGYYLVGYALMNLGAFGVLMLLNQRGDGNYSFDSLRGMGTVYPLLGLTMSVYMLSLTGIPPTAGFFGKLYVFRAAIMEGHLTLAIIGLLNSAVAAYYYLKVLMTMYMSKAEGEIHIEQPMSYKAALAVSSLLIILIGMFPEQLVSAMLKAVP